jgi:hypothetical protein
MPSSVILSYNYDTDTGSLNITYVSGVVYTYRLVPERIYKEFKASLSKGRYLNFHIKGKYDFEKTATY